MNMSIRKNLGTSVLSAVLLLAAGIPAWAANSQKVVFHHDFVLNGTTVPAGKYQVRWNSPEGTVNFVQQNKVVLSTEGRLEKRARSYDRDGAVYNTNPDGTMSLVEIRSAYSNKVLTFNQKDLTLKAAR
jgi:hypothetical protein